LLKPGTAIALRNARQELVAQRAELDETITMLDRVLGQPEPPARRSVAAAVKAAPAPTTGRGGSRSPRGPSSRPLIVQVLKGAASGLTAIEVKSRVQRLGGPEGVEGAKLIQSTLGSMKLNGLVALSGDGIWTLTKEGKEWKPRGEAA